MIELRNMTRKERTLVSVQCDRFFLTINKLKSAQPVFDILVDSLGLERKYYKELWCVITCVGKALRSGNNGSQFPLFSKHYAEANTHHNLGLNHNRASFVIKELDRLGWITYYKGYKNLKNSEDVMRSCITFSKNLKVLYSAKLIGMYSRQISAAEMIEVKDPETKEPFMKLTKFKGVSDHRNFMKNYNGLLAEASVKVCGVPCAVTYKQVFSGDLESGGRYYTFGSFQTAKSELRPYITINGDKVTEVDIRGVHPAICRLLQGCKPLEEGFDPYGITNIYGVTDKELRGLCKSALMCMINCKTKVGASKALLNIIAEDLREVEEDQELKGFSYLTLEEAKLIISKIEKRNKPVKFFGKGSFCWQELQRYDSKVCEGVLRRFINKGIPVLCWHDSWVCQVQYQDFLIDSIRQSWFEVFSTYDNCFLKIEF